MVVCIAGSDVEGCLDNVRAHTAEDVEVVVCDGQRELTAAIERSRPADVVILRPDCRVSDGWLDGLRAAAQVDSRVATASPLLSPDQLGLSGLDFHAAAAAIRAGSMRVCPRVGPGLGPCLYVRRSALDLVGPPTFSEPTGFGRRCSEAGLAHVLADDVLVLREKAHGVSGRSATRHSSAAAQRSLRHARRALSGLSVVVDARILTGPVTGTHVQVLAIISALARQRGLTVTVVVPDDLNEGAAAQLDSLPAVLVTRSADAARTIGGEADLVHRPYQVNEPSDLAFLATLGGRLIITHQDLIAYANPWYFPEPGTWEDYRRLTRLSLAVADHVVFISAHAREDALAEQLVEPARASVILNGVDHGPSHPADSHTRPPGGGRLPAQAPFLLCLGTDYRHKNRPFALQVLKQLRARHGWDGYLCFAGPSASSGSSRPEEERWLAAHPREAVRVIDLGPVGESEKAWLYRHAACVLYPTTFEGFGLVPFEAAAYDTPCAWAPGTALSEVLPDGAAAIVPWDAGASAARIRTLIEDGPARKEHLRAVRAAGASLTWDAAGAQLVELYRAVCDSPPPPLGVLERTEGLMSGEVTLDAVQLFGPGGLIPPELERPLLALATHRRVSRPLFDAVRLAYRAAFRLRRSRRVRA